MTAMSLKRVFTISKFKLKTLNKNKVVLSYFAAPILFALLFSMVYSKAADGNMNSTLKTMVLNMGLLTNLSMVGIMVPSTLLAEEKEKNTLRVLMVSSIKGNEFFIGSILPVWFLMLAINVVLPFISGIHFTVEYFLIYFLLSSVCSLISCILGMCLGILSKDQMAASLVSMPAMLILMMLPMFKDLSSVIEKINRFLYSGLLNTIVTGLIVENKLIINIKDILVLLGTLLICIIWFIYLYKRNGFEKD